MYLEAILSFNWEKASQNQDTDDKCRDFTETRIDIRNITLQEAVKFDFKKICMVEEHCVIFQMRISFQRLMMILINIFK